MRATSTAPPTNRRRSAQAFDAVAAAVGTTVSSIWSSAFQVGAQHEPQFVAEARDGLAIDLAPRQAAPPARGPCECGAHSGLVERIGVRPDPCREVALRRRRCPGRVLLCQRRATPTAGARARSSASRTTLRLLSSSNPASSAPRESAIASAVRCSRSALSKPIHRWRPRIAARCLASRFDRPTGIAAGRTAPCAGWCMQAASPARAKAVLRVQVRPTQARFSARSSSKLGASLEAESDRIAAVCDGRRAE